ncbi:MAG: hypothetical protein R3E84_16535 [Pseudomonadales bacterium]
MMVTTQSEDGDPADACDAGVDAILGKPFSKDDLARELDRLLLMPGRRLDEATGIAGAAARIACCRRNAEGASNSRPYCVARRTGVPFRPAIR